MRDEYEIISRNIYIAESNFHRIVVIDDAFPDYIAKLKASYTELLVSFYPLCQRSKLRRQEWGRYKKAYDIFAEKADQAWNVYSSRDLSRAIQPRYTFDGQTIKKSLYIPNKNVVLYCTELNDAITFIHTGDPENKADVETVRKHSEYHHQGFLYLSTTKAETNLCKRIAPGRWKELKRLSSEYEQLSNIFLSQATNIFPSKTEKPILLKYINFFQHLNRSNRAGEFAPHKVILLLAVLHLYDDPKQQNKTVIELSNTLKVYFNMYWEAHVKSPIWTKDISMPWTHMKSEPFWYDCQNKEGCCWIEPELRDLLKDKENRVVLIDVLMDQLSTSISNRPPKIERENLTKIDAYRSNKRWSKSDVKKLKEAFHQGTTFYDIARMLHRTETAIASKLQDMGYVKWDRESETYIRIN